MNRLAALSWAVNAVSETFVKTGGWSEQSKHRRMNAGRNIREKSKSAGVHITQRTVRCCAARQLLPKKPLEQSASERGTGFSCCWWGVAGVLITRCWEEGKHIHQLHSWLHTQNGTPATQKQGTYFRFDWAVFMSIAVIISISNALILVILCFIFKWKNVDTSKREKKSERDASRTFCSLFCSSFVFKKSPNVCWFFFVFTLQLASEVPVHQFKKISHTDQWPVNWMFLWNWKSETVMETSKTFLWNMWVYIGKIWNILV